MSRDISNLSAYLQVISNHLASRATPLPDDPLLQVRRIVASCLIAQNGLASKQELAANSYRVLVPKIIDVLSRMPGARELVAELNKEAAAPVSFSRMEPLIQKSIPFMAGVSEAGATELLKKIAEIDYLLESETRVDSQAMRRSGALDGDNSAVLSEEALSKLGAFLKMQSGETHALEIATIELIVGGHSKQTLIAELKNNTVLPQFIVIRHDQPSMQGGSNLAHEWRIINILHAAGAAVPEPLAIEAEEKVLDGPFMVVSKVDGQNVGDCLDLYCGSEALGLDLALKVAQIHKIPAARFGQDIAGAKIDSKSRMRELINQLENEWRSWGGASTSLETAFWWLKSHIGVIGDQRTLVHGDIGFHNFLVKDDEITGLLDWEQASIGSPAQDLGYLYHSAVQLVEWQRFMDAYAAAGAIPPTQAEIDFFSLWASVWLTVISLRCKRAFEAGQIGGEQFGHISAYLLQRVYLMLTDKLRKIL